MVEHIYADQNLFSVCVSILLSVVHMGERERGMRKRLRFTQETLPFS